MGAAALESLLGLPLTGRPDRPGVGEPNRDHRVGGGRRAGRVAGSVDRRVHEQVARGAWTAPGEARDQTDEHDQPHLHRGAHPGPEPDRGGHS